MFEAGLAVLSCGSALRGLMNSFLHLHIHVHMSSHALLLPLLVAASLLHLAGCLTPAQWRSQSIYQVMTDRFARTDGSTTASCTTSQGIYCGGTWAGLINKLDYIQNMGFTAIWISPIPEQLSGNSNDGASYHVSNTRAGSGLFLYCSLAIRWWDTEERRNVIQYVRHRLVAALTAVHRATGPKTSAH